MQGGYRNTLLEVWVGGLYQSGMFLGELQGKKYVTQAVDIEGGFLLHKDTRDLLINSRMEQIQFNGIDVAYRIPVEFLLDTCETFGDILWCDKSYMSKPVKLNEVYNDVEESRWIK